MTVVFNQSCNGSHSSYIKEDNLNPLTTLQRMVYYLMLILRIWNCWLKCSLLPVQHQFCFWKPPFIVQRVREWKRIVQLSSLLNIQLNYVLDNILMHAIEKFLHHNCIICVTSVLYIANSVMCQATLMTVVHGQSNFGNSIHTYKLDCTHALTWSCGRCCGFCCCCECPITWTKRYVACSVSDINRVTICSLST